MADSEDIQFMNNQNNGGGGDIVADSHQQTSSFIGVDEEQQQQQQQQGLTSSQTPESSINNTSPSTSTNALIGSISTPFSRHLGRNRACSSCRERKLKCDGIRPICGQCARAWAAKRKSMKGKGVSEEEMRNMEKPCMYLEAKRESVDKGGGKAGRGSTRSKPSIRDTVDAASGGKVNNNNPKTIKETPLQEAQRERRRLEQELNQLKARFGIPTTPSPLQQHENHEAVVAAAVAAAAAADQNFHPNPDELSIAEVLANTMRSGETGFSTESRASISEALNSTSFTHFVEGLTQGNHTTSSEQIDPLLLGEEQAGTSISMDNTTDLPADPLMQLVLTGWPADFPPPAMVDKLIGIFFESYAHLRYLFHPVRFFENLSQGPTSSRYPHPAILHAMFALAYQIRPDLDMLLPKDRTDQTNPQEALDDEQIRQQHSFNKPYSDPGSQAGHRQGIIIALQSRYDRDRAKMGSSGYHADRAQHHIRKSMWEGGNLMAIAQASVMLVQKRYGSGEVFDAWMGASTATRLSVCLSINRSNPTSPDNSTHTGKTPIDTIRLAMSGAPTDWIEEEERRRLMFLILATDRTACASTLFANSLSDDDVTVELPRLTNYDFVEGNSSALTNAPRQTLQSPNLFTEHHIDGFNTMIKAGILMGKIGSFLARLSGFATCDDMIGSSTFEMLDNTLSAFSLSLPFRATDVDERGQFDIFRFATYVVQHSNSLLLHSPLIRLHAQSAAMCETACQSLLSLLRIMISAGIEFSRLPSVIIFCLGTLGKVLVRRLQILRGQSALTTTMGGVDRPTTSSSSSSNNIGQQEVAENTEIDAKLYASIANRIDRFNMTMHAAGPYTWSFIPTSSDLGASPAMTSANSAGLGGATMSSSKEEKLRDEIDLVFTYLCKIGTTWPMAIRQAQTLAQMLGINTADPVALRYGIFNEKNHSQHSYEK